RPRTAQRLVDGRVKAYVSRIETSPVDSKILKMQLSATVSRQTRKSHSRDGAIPISSTTSVAEIRRQKAEVFSPFRFQSHDFPRTPLVVIMRCKPPDRKPWP